jgi:phosphatidylethanolamine-binding protein (PEBP) family uncharacterized protein|tara:strand:+ start:390 stop:830 length:441 start_codon:yes stop_codon:yes gene_type:complete
MNKITFIFFLIIYFGISSTAYSAEKFTINFDDWGFPGCSGGNPFLTDNPEFVFGNLPQGTIKINFQLMDKDAPGFGHGGGNVEIKNINDEEGFVFKKDGNILIKQGAFKYLCPCPPGGSHRYQWQATAYDENDKFLKRAKIEKKYP